ncbi:MAG: hypothetical protein BWY25_03055 [Chloroflexi bacterium ADurb.Bin222]|nr:MAG: hypothetical protein BWY25_03055 [Chloroflexi bacterium ADurb.Bin222]
MRQLRGRLMDAGFGFCPRATAEMAEMRSQALCSNIAAQTVSLVDWHVEAVAPLVFQQQILALDVIHTAGHQPLEDADAVVLVHHHRARLQVGEGEFGRGNAAPRAAARFGRAPSEELLIGDEVAGDSCRAVLRGRSRRQVPSSRHHPLHKRDQRLRCAVEVFVNRRRRELLPELRQSRRLATDNHNLVAELGPLPQPSQSFAQFSGEMGLRRKDFRQRSLFTWVECQHRALCQACLPILPAHVRQRRLTARGVLGNRAFLQRFCLVVQLCPTLLESRPMGQIDAAFRGQITEQRGCFLVHIREITFQRGEGHSCFQGLQVAFQRDPYLREQVLRQGVAQGIQGALAVARQRLPHGREPEALGATR